MFRNMTFDLKYENFPDEDKKKKYSTNRIAQKVVYSTVNFFKSAGFG